MNKFTILVNTCDKFEDCWYPFFKLFAIYWPDYKGKIYLNTEQKDFSYKGLDIVPLRIIEPSTNKRYTWSECLILALNKINENVILYMQEDYFIKGQVNDELIKKYVGMMDNHPDIHCIHLTDQAVIPDSRPSVYEGLYPAIHNQRYRISCQAALWRKNILLSYLRPYESAWDFEQFGSKRSANLDHNIFVVDNNWVKLDQFEIIPYIFTGIIQGKWYEKVIPLFEKHNIDINYSKRGFSNERIRKTLLKKIKDKCIHFILMYRNYFEIKINKHITK